MKTAFITGGSKGIGLGVAEALLHFGYKVFILAREKASLDKVIGELNTKYPNKIDGMVADVRHINSMHNAVLNCNNIFGKIDVLIANAGVGHFANFENLSDKQWNETIDINLTGVFNSVKACLANLMETEGYIVTIASLAGTNFFENGTAYNASKFGLVGFSQALMLDLRPKNVKVTTIMPGSVATNFNNHVPSTADAWKIQPEDIGQMVVDLLKMNPRTLPSKIEVRPSQTKN
jgi:3-oxoacyl-[acyl-carrier protein] reductase